MNDQRKQPAGPECKHTFFNILNDVDQLDIRSAHAIIGCCWCGQIRKLYTDGRVKVLVRKGIFSYEI